MRKILIETSARHLHVTKEHLETLFGKGAELAEIKMLSQPGQFLSDKKVDIIGEKGTQKGVSVLGPVRPATQVELSATDARSIGIEAPVRESGDIQNSGKCKIAGPAGEVEIDTGVVVAKRHIHVSPDEAKELDVRDQQIVNVKIESDSRKTMYGDVVVRVNPNFSAAMHIDTDESNAAGCTPGMFGEII